jgi:hypothetical protein
MDEPAVNELLCQKLGMDFVPIIFTASGGMGECSVPETVLEPTLE